ncbi:hypothetical protein JRQ81_011435 [Phrynocephalus forsythii]|uniref:Uncharacterized protein n=1 Tax=Phrynocephalus forsythii TaxID=171643 RepID=A0A9Q0X7U7_9SAUR|nr:hypothetical protein JRQ81_011435 [Phrynocephalus forsythii]
MLSAKVSEPDGQLLVRKKAGETQEGPALHPRCAQAQSGEHGEAGKGSPNRPSSRIACTPPSPNAGVPCVAATCRCTLGPITRSDGFPSLRSLRRSLSWPEDLSMRVATEGREAAVSPGRAVFCPGGHEDQQMPSEPLAKVALTGTRPVVAPEVHVTLVDSSGASCPEDGADHLLQGPLLSVTDVSDDGRFSPGGNLNEGPPSALRRLTLGLQRISSSWTKEGGNALRLSPPMRKGGRRFGRSVSHESGLPLPAGRQEEEEAALAGQTTAQARILSGQTPQSALKSFKAYGRQVCVTRKHIVMAFAGLRKRDGQSPPLKAEPSKVALPENSC